METTDCKPSAALLQEQQQRRRIDNAVSFDSILDDVDDEADGVPQVDLIQIVVKRTGGSEAPCLELSIENDATVINLKTLIQDELADESPCLMVPVDRQRLLYAGKMLTDNNLKLVNDIKMRTDSVNYIVLAPLPKNVAPTARTPLENKSQSRRQKTRSNRMPRPYSVPLVVRRCCQPEETISTQPSLGRAFREGSPPRHNSACSGAHDQVFLNHMARQSLFPSLEAMLGNSHSMIDDAVLNASELMPLCGVITSNVSEILDCNSSDQDEHVMRTTEQTILLLDQLSQRSTTLARSLRANLREQRQRQLLSARELLNNGGLPWGSY